MSNIFPVLIPFKFYRIGLGISQNIFKQNEHRDHSLLAVNYLVIVGVGVAIDAIIVAQLFADIIACKFFYDYGLQAVKFAHQIVIAGFLRPEFIQIGQKPFNLTVGPTVSSLIGRNNKT